jgi:hypothetical protein
MLPPAAAHAVESAHTPVTHRDHVSLVQPLEPSQVDELKSSLGAQLPICHCVGCFVSHKRVA